MAAFVILGAGGDVTSRYVVPGLVQLHEHMALPEDLRVLAVGRHGRDDEEYRDELRAAACADGCGEVSVDEVLERVIWVEADATDRAALADLAIGDDGEVVVYLALPPSVFAETIDAIAGAPWATRARVALEKPFGTDRSSARELNELLGEHFDDHQVFRVDHFLGMSVVRGLPELLARPSIDALWHSRVVESIEIVWDETLALEGRAGYYDTTGALVDMLQNHLLQVLAVSLSAAMPAEMPVHQRRLAALHGLQAHPDASVRARYTSGEVADQRVPSYVDEDGVDPTQGTETFASVELTSDDARWAGVALRLRSGKALATDRHCLRVGLAGGDEMVVDLETGALTLSLGDAVLSAEAHEPTRSPYARVLGDLLAGDQTWFVGDVEAELQWRIVEPVLDSWRRGTPPLGEYPAGTAGPPT